MACGIGTFSVATNQFNDFHTGMVVSYSDIDFSLRESETELYGYYQDPFSCRRNVVPFEQLVQGTGRIMSICETEFTMCCTDGSIESSDLIKGNPSETFKLGDFSIEGIVESVIRVGDLYTFVCVPTVEYYIAVRCEPVYNYREVSEDSWFLGSLVPSDTLDENQWLFIHGRGFVHFGCNSCFGQYHNMYEKNQLGRRFLVKLKRMESMPRCKIKTNPSCTVDELNVAAFEGESAIMGNEEAHLLKTSRLAPTKIIPRSNILGDVLASHLMLKDSHSSIKEEIGYATSISHTYGWIYTPALPGKQIYFHRNAVVGLTKDHKSILSFLGPRPTLCSVEFSASYSSKTESWTAHYVKPCSTQSKNTHAADPKGLHSCFGKVQVVAPRFGILLTHEAGCIYFDADALSEKPRRLTEVFSTGEIYRVVYQLSRNGGLSILKAVCFPDLQQETRVRYFGNVSSPNILCDLDDEDSNLTPTESEHDFKCSGSVVTTSSGSGTLTNGNDGESDLEIKSPWANEVTSKPNITKAAKSRKSTEFTNGSSQKGNSHTVTIQQSPPALVASPSIISPVVSAPQSRPKLQPRTASPPQTVISTEVALATEPAPSASNAASPPAADVSSTSAAQQTSTNGSQLLSRRRAALQYLSGPGVASAGRGQRFFREVLATQQSTSSGRGTA